MEKGASTPIHYHERDHEAFYVLSGKVRFVSAGSESQYLVEAGPGTILVCPNYCTRSFQAMSEAIMIVIDYLYYVLGVRAACSHYDTESID
jgi:uncharacterized RmlC-like cupin family protein